ncbi:MULTISPECIES: TRAP transporter substrate-binding protein [Marinovum]|uniref:TRAP-type mannitol/chloroaromatic compound transport system, substrate-binding protein n=1 Tax=Marinovum algicola TaxID=42444 RepID=A0A975W844_9RHOB|nr:TRAP transporter substrate-binding protein [Marinovum algicola]SEJ03016.1 TRAP-type mannitol/chloroaromatic compound transport system, substrate-binding protein [Marinovum algicola]SLN18189.1 Lactate-binding periplasmic protein precursor [Marinovum algicola]
MTAYTLKSALLSGLVAATSLMASTALAQEYQWTFQTSAQAGDNFFPIEEAWADRVKELSDGRIEITVVPVGTVVAHNETLDAVGAGILQGHITDPSYFSGKDPAFAMLGNLVGAWSAPEQMFDYMENGGGKALFNELVNPYGLQFLGASATGVEAFLSTKPLYGVDDLKGIKMRAPEGMVQEVFAAAGASPVNLPGSEVYTALEKGVIDAADYTVFSTNHAQGMHEFAKYPLYPGFHSMPVIDVSLNKAIYDGLPEDLQTILNESVSVFAEDMITQLDEQNEAAVAEAQADPEITVIDWSDEERAKFRGIAKSQWAKWADRSEMAGKAYESVTAYLTDKGLLAE